KCPKKLSFRRSRRSHSTRSVRRSRQTWAVALCWPMRLRDQYGISRRAHRTRVAICGGCAEFHDSLGTRQTAFARQATRKNGKRSAVVTAVYRPPTCLGQAVSDETACHSLPGDHLA